MMRLWMKVTLDELELPLIVASSCAELAFLCGTTERAIRSAVCRYNKGQTKICPYRVVWMEDEE